MLVCGIQTTEQESKIINEMLKDNNYFHRMKKSGHTLAICMFAINEDILNAPNVAKVLRLEVAKYIKEHFYCLEERSMRNKYPGKDYYIKRRLQAVRYLTGNSIDKVKEDYDKSANGWNVAN